MKRKQSVLRGKILKILRESPLPIPTGDVVAIIFKPRDVRDYWDRHELLARVWWHLRYLERGGQVTRIKKYRGRWQTAWVFVG